MKTNSFKKAIAVGMIGLTALGATAVAPSIADAQTAEDPTEQTEQTDGTRERRADRQARKAEKQAAMAELLNTTVEELQADREAGMSIADIAAANGVDLDTVIAEMVADKTAHIQEHVAAGDITQTEADEKIAGLEERITEKVNADPADPSEREGRRGHRGSRGGSSSAEVEPASA